MAATIRMISVGSCTASHISAQMLALSSDGTRLQPKKRWRCSGDHGRRAGTAANRLDLRLVQQPLVEVDVEALCHALPM